MTRTTSPNEEPLTGEVKEDLESLHNLLRDLLTEIRDLGKHSVSMSRKGAEQLRDKADERVTAAVDKGCEAFEELKSRAEQRPLTTLAITFVLGLFAGLLVDRRK